MGSLFGKPTIGNYANNFLVRVRDKFADKGYVVVLPDVPPDRPKADYKYRLGDEQKPTQNRLSRTWKVRGASKHRIPYVNFSMST